MKDGDKEKFNQNCYWCGGDLGILILEMGRQNRRALFKYMKGPSQADTCDRSVFCSGR